MTTRAPITRVGPVRRGLVGVGTLVALWVACSFSLSYGLADGAPAVAVRLWPTNLARIQLANKLLAEDPAGNKAEAGALALNAVRRSPIDAGGVSLLGSLAVLNKHKTEADRAFSYAEKLSRRDLPTQFYMIEENVTRENVEGALVHYDRALRVSRPAQRQLFPVLIAASEDPQIAYALAQVMGRRPLWWFDLADDLIGSVPNPKQILPIFLGALHLDATKPTDRRLIGKAIDHLIGVGASAQALAIYDDARHSASTLLRNGGFEEESTFSPFDWRLADGPDLSASIQMSPTGRGKVLTLEASNDATGEVASQLLVLPAGAYRLTLRYGQISAPGELLASARIRCRRTPDDLINMPVQRTGSISGHFVVPAGCETQTLSISLAANTDPAMPLPWIDDVAITRMARQL